MQMFVFKDRSFQIRTREQAQPFGLGLDVDLERSSEWVKLSLKTSTIETITESFPPGTEKILIDILHSGSPQPLLIGSIAWSDKPTRDLKYGLHIHSDLLALIPQTGSRTGLGIETLMLRKNPAKKSWEALTRWNTVSGHWELHRAMTVNIPRILLHLALGNQVTVRPTFPWRGISVGRNLSPRYVLDFRDIFVDYDETLVLEGVVVEEVLRFLKDQSTSGIGVHILTRNLGDVRGQMERIGLQVDVFDSLKQVQPGDLKSKYVTQRSLFIDNEFPQRQDVWSRTGVPAIDLDQLDFFRPLA